MKQITEIGGNELPSLNCMPHMFRTCRESCHKIKQRINTFVLR